MDSLQKIHRLDSAQLREYAHSLSDGRELDGVIAELFKSGTLEDLERIAVILTCVPLDGGETGDFFAADRREPCGKRYLDRFIKACRARSIPESEYIALPISVKYAAPESELYAMSDAAETYIEKRAEEDFDFVADCVDLYDKKFRNYAVLMRVSPQKSTERLIEILLYKKHINKSAARGALMGYSESVHSLFALYEKCNARERLALLRIFLLFKNDREVAEFLDSAVAADKSKTVRDALAAAILAKSGEISGSALKKGNAAAFFENAMIAATPIPYSEMRKIVAVSKKTAADAPERECAAICDRLFFYTLDEYGSMRLLLFNKGRFIDTRDDPVKLAPSDEIFVLHPIDIPSDMRDLDGLSPKQPFLQLARPTFYPLANEAVFSSRLVGTMIGKREFEENFKSGGFAFTTENGAATSVAVKITDDHAVAVECDIPSSGGTVTCGRIFYYRASSVVKNDRKVYLATEPVRVRDVPKRQYSELTYAVYKLFGCAAV